MAAEAKCSPETNLAEESVDNAVVVTGALTAGAAKHGPYDAMIFGGAVDTAITWLVDLFYSLPHLVLLILISFALGGGLRGTLIAAAITHWPGLTRVIRAEAMQVAAEERSGTK